MNYSDLYSQLLIQFNKQIQLKAMGVEKKKQICLFQEQADFLC